MFLCPRLRLPDPSGTGQEVWDCSAAAIAKRECPLEIVHIVEEHALAQRKNIKPNLLRVIMLTKKDTFITPVLVGRVGDQRMLLWQNTHGLAPEGHKNIRETVREILRLDTFKRCQELSCREGYEIRAFKLWGVVTS